MNRGGTTAGHSVGRTTRDIIVKNLLWAGGLAIVISTVGVPCRLRRRRHGDDHDSGALKPSISSGQPEVFRATVAPPRSA